VQADDEAIANSLQAKAKGNALCAESKWEEAADEYTNAIEFDDTNHVFFANRSACLVHMRNYDEALEDASRCVTLDPSWVKGYVRKAQAECYVRLYADAEQTSRAGLELDAANQPLLKQLQELRDAGHVTNAEEDAKHVNADLAAAAKAKGNASFGAGQFHPGR
jgi:stress-induced-phosphoprotein 1